MRTLVIELRKEKRTGVILLMPAVGILGAFYALLYFTIQKEVLFSLPSAPMDVLLTQLYGMTMILNLFGVIVGACMIYHLEFKGSAIKKMYLLPVSVPALYFCKFLILSILLLVAAAIQNLALVKIGLTELPQGAFEFDTLLTFAGYAVITSMPVLTFMIFVSSRFSNMWVPLGIGVSGFLSGMALAPSEGIWLCIHPFVVMLKPAVAMSTRPDTAVVLFSLTETILFLSAGLWTAQNLRYE